MSIDTFDAVAREQIRFIQDRLMATARWAESSGVDAAATEFLVRPYRRLLDDMYQRDLPLARLADESDLLLHVRGPAASGPTPRVSVLTRLLGGTRDQVTRLAKQLGGVTTVRVPLALDLGFVGLAEGSLYLGFTTDDEVDATATRSAVDSIAAAGALVAADASLDSLASRFADPAERDMAVAAVRQLSPSGQAGITEIDLLGRRIAHPVALTTATRRHARRLMAQPPAMTQLRLALDTTSFVGTVRELDLDAARFEIRNVDGFPDGIRCAHELGEEDAKQLVDLRVRVKGRPEHGPAGDSSEVDELLHQGPLPLRHRWRPDPHGHRRRLSSRGHHFRQARGDPSRASRARPQRKPHASCAEQVNHRAGSYATVSNSVTGGDTIAGPRRNGRRLKGRGGLRQLSHQW